MSKHSPHHGAVLVIAPPLVLPAYQRYAAPYGTVHYAASMGEAALLLARESIAAIVYHAEEAHREVGASLARWFADTQGATPLLALVTTWSHLTPVSAPELQPYASMLFSMHHQRPDEVLAKVVESSLDIKKKKGTPSLRPGSGQARSG
ncbi:MAG: hypothetical protein AB1352_00780 [Patescibacteria group bacterium]